MYNRILRSVNGAPMNEETGIMVAKDVELMLPILNIATGGDTSISHPRNLFPEDPLVISKSSKFSRILLVFQINLSQVSQLKVYMHCMSPSYLDNIQVSQEERLLFWEVTVSAILSKIIFIDVCPIPNGFRGCVISLYISKIVDKKNILRTVSNTGIYSSSDKIGRVCLVLSRVCWVTRQ
jgi:hypothetical protein